MPSFNKVILMGNLTRDPELRVTAKGMAICQVGLAVNRSYKDGSGQEKDETLFVDLEAWSKTGETINKHLRKGSSALFEGRLKMDTWEDKQSGQKRSKVKVVVDSVIFLGKAARAGEEGSQEVNTQEERRGPEKKATPAARENIDEDVPF